MSGPQVYSFAAVSKKYGVHKVAYTPESAGSAEYWKDQFPDCGKVWIEPLIPQSAYDTLRAQLEAAEANAARYEWLRENDQERSDVFLANSHEELDAAIDAAMSRTKEETK